MTPRDPRAPATRRRRGRGTRAGAILVAFASAAMLAGCAADAPVPTPSGTSESAPAPGASDPAAASTPPGTAPAEPAATPSADDTGPAPTAEPAAGLVPDGTAADNLPLFTRVTEAVWRSSRRAQGRAYIDALVDAGFDKAAMQVTPDRSTVGNPAESMQFSVLWRGECLVGQVGPDIGEAVTRVLPALQDGTVCLVGETRPIDW